MFLPGEFQGQGSLVGCRLWGRTESDTTESELAVAGFPADSVVKNLPEMQETQVRSLEKERQPTPVLSGESHEERSLAGYSPWVTES